MKPDFEKYRQFVDDFDLPEAEKIELINTIWNVMESFVDRAFGINSSQQAIAARDEKHALLDAPMIELETTYKITKSIRPTFELQVLGEQEG